MTDTLHRTIAEDGKFFGIACETTQLVNVACKRHDVGPTAAVALARALTGASLLAALLKDGQSVQLKFEGSGPLGKIITEAGYDGWARGYVAAPHADVPLKNGLIDVAAGLGRAGFLSVTKDIGAKRKYQGMVQLYTSEIGDDIAYYLLESEQTPSVVALSVNLRKDGTISGAGGFLIQALPPVDDEIISALEQRVQKLSSFAGSLENGETPDLILSKLLTDIPHRATASRALVYQCSCSRSKMEAAILSLGHGEIQKLIAEQEGAEVVCEFCREKYAMSGADLKKLLSSKSENH